MPSTHLPLQHLPDYLRPFIAKQDPSLYTPMDQASWRFILKISRQFFKQNAHQKYIDGLSETGISGERIPLIEEMDACLSRFGWRAVAVNGFIPPAIFMEFQSLGILPIACEMRTLDHLAYTPAPDIVHEAAGHAPIIADPEYSDYLRNYGEVSRKAIYSSEDMALFEAIRKLSVVKEDPTSTSAEILAAEENLESTSKKISYISEAAELARMNWWTVEYGLVGTIDAPKIYGAGLLSSVGESYSCLQSEVKKIPLTVDCVNVSYDITRPQPQLFVTPNFQYLTKVLHEYSARMAFKLGGNAGLKKALESKTVTTTVLDSGLQISGVLSQVNFPEVADQKSPFRSIEFLNFSGPVQLSYEDSELPSQGPEHHSSGFSTALGKVLPYGKCLSVCSDDEVKALNGRLEFCSGITVTGELKSILRKKGKVILLSFEPCTVTRKSADREETLFKPEWGVFDLACGTEVVSVYGGAADRKNYLTKTGGLQALSAVPKCNLTKENTELNALYLKVRKLREEKSSAKETITKCVEIASRLHSEYSHDWLLRLELMELLTLESDRDETLLALREATLLRMHQELDAISGTRKDRAEMIRRGKEAFLK
jgi:phenylalanine-4-hydroxylase